MSHHIQPLICRKLDEIILHTVPTWFEIEGCKTESSILEENMSKGQFGFVLISNVNSEMTCIEYLKSSYKLYILFKKINL